MGGKRLRIRKSNLSNDCYLSNTKECLCIFLKGLTYPSGLVNAYLDLHTFNCPIYHLFWSKFI